jgi:3-phenylpropionate/trans-cinnamate dioxygenase ferredoxin subunit
MTFVSAAKLDDIPQGQGRVVTVGDEEVALCNAGGAIYAVANVCSHDGGPLGEGHLVGGQIECPRHGARFDVRTGEAKSLPAIVPIPTFPVKVVGRDVLVEVD